MVARLAVRLGLGVALLAAACGAPEDSLGWPRISFKSRGGGDEATESSLVVDHTGRYVSRGSGDNGRGTIHTKVCTGDVGSERVQPWFSRMTAGAAPRDPKPPSKPDADGESKGPARRRASVVYEPAKGETATVADYDSLLDESKVWLSEFSRARPADEVCDETKQPPKR